MMRRFLVKVFNLPLRIKAGIAVSVFIFTQCEIGADFAYAGSGKAENLRKPAVAEAAGSGSAKALGEVITAISNSIRGVLRPITEEDKEGAASRITNKDVFDRVQAMLQPIVEYDRDKIKERIKLYIDPATGRERPEHREIVQQIIHEEMSKSNRGRAQDVERVAKEVAAECLNNDVDVIATRHSRAFDTAAKLLANSIVVESNQLRDTVTKLENSIDRHIGFKEEQLSQRYNDALGRLAPEVLFFVNLLLQKDVSMAQIEGGAKRLRKQIGILRTNLLGAVDESGLVSEWWIKRERARVLRSLEGLEKLIRKTSKAFKDAPKRHPIFNVELSNTFIPMDSYNIFWTNERYDPLDSPDLEMAKLVKQARNQVHATPNSPEFLKYCQDWVEALPAHASYYIDDHGKVVPHTVRNIMKGLYLGYAEPWIENVEWAMQTEHVALARQFLVDRPEFAAQISAIMKKSGVDREEAVRLLVIQLVDAGRINKQDIADVAAIIWQSYFYLRPKIAQEAEKAGYGADRYEILKKFLYEDKSEGNLFSKLLSSVKADDVVSGHSLSSQAQRMLWTTLNKRRALPMLHIMTTLAPGETTKIQNWIEEAMSLYLMCREHGFEPEVRRRYEAYSKRMRAIAGRLSEELALDPDKPEEKARLNDEAAKLYFLIESERPVADTSNDPEDVSDIRAVQEYFDAHPEILREAEDFVVKELAGKGTSDEIKQKYAAQIRGEALCRARHMYMREKGVREDSRIKERIDPNSGKFNIRRDLVAEHGLSEQLGDSLYNYTASGVMPDWYIGYDPSRVDLGPEIVSSEKDVPKICSANNPQALRRSYRMYSLYNIDPSPLHSTSDGKFAKVQENFITRGGPYYLSLGAGITLEAIARGTWSVFMGISNKRGDRKVSPTGSDYRGFCVPKEWCLMTDAIKLAADPRTRDLLFDEWGMPKDKELRQLISDDFQKVINNLPLYATEEEVISVARKMLSNKYSEYIQFAQREVTIKDDDGTERTESITAVYIARLPELLQLMAKIGNIHNEWLADARKYSIEIASWTVDGLMKLEQINRIGQFRKLLKVYEGLKYRWYNDSQLQKLWGVLESDNLEQRTEKFRNWMRTVVIVGCPPYKESTQDYRFSGFAAFLELASGLYYNTMKYLDDDARRIFKDMVTDMFGSVTAPTFGGITMVGPVGWDGVAGNMPDIQTDFAKFSQIARSGIKEFLGEGAIADEAEQDAWIDVNRRAHGLDFANWEWHTAFPGLLMEDQLRERLDALYEKISLQLIYLVFGTSYNEIADNVRIMLKNAFVGSKSLDGNPDTAIKGYCIKYKGDLRLWPEIKEMLESSEPDTKKKAKALIRAIGPVINMLAAREEDVHTRNEMQKMVARADVVNLGIPETELLDLLASEKLPFTLSEMRRLQENPTFLFVDGTAGARFPFAESRDPATKNFVKRLLNLEPKAVYEPMGTGFEDVRVWQAEMQKERSMAQDLLTAIQSSSYKEAEKALETIRRYYMLELKTHESINFAEIARDRGLKSYDAYKYKAEQVSGVCSGKIDIKHLDFVTFLALGGQYLVDGKYESAEALEEAARTFNSEVAGLGPEQNLAAAVAAGAGRTKGQNAFLSYAVGVVVPHVAQPFAQVATGVRTSMKDITEALGAVAEYLNRIMALEQKQAMAARKNAFDETQEILEAAPHAFEVLYSGAVDLLPQAGPGNPDYRINPDTFGAFLAHTKYAYISLLNRIMPDEKDKLKKKLAAAINSTFGGGLVTTQEYAQLTKLLGELAECADNNTALLEEVARMGELLDITFLMENCFSSNVFDLNPRIHNMAPTWKAVAAFMDKSVNNHIFDYWPWHIDKERGAGFESYSREEKFEIASRINSRWLYPFLRWALVNKTEMAQLEPSYADKLLGEYHGGITRLGIGVGGETEAQKAWYSYGRIRDIAVLRAEGNPLPEVFEGLSPEVINAANRRNLAVVYPCGNTTIPYATKRNPQQNLTGVNLFTCAFPEIEEGEDGRKYARVKDAFTWMSKVDYEKSLREAGEDEDVIARRLANIDVDKGVVVLAGFSRPITVDGVWFHTFNVKRTRIDEIEGVLVQPFLWEALTHLKCDYADMYGPYGISTPAQKEFKMSREAVKTRFGGNMPEWMEALIDIPDVTQAQQMEQVKKAILELCLGTNCSEIIIKPEVESGGRGTEIFQIKDEKGRLINENLEAAVVHAASLLKVDDIVVQAFIRSRVRQMFSKKFIRDIEARFAAELGIAVDVDEPLFTYNRTILVAADEQHPEFERAKAILAYVEIEGRTYFITHYIGGISSEGVANIGRGGRLFMLRGEDIDRKLNPKYRQDAMWSLREVSFRAMKAQRAHLRKNWKVILADYLKHNPAFAEDENIKSLFSQDALPEKYLEIPYEMGDYLAYWLVDEHDNVKQVYDWDRETDNFVDLYDSEGAWKGVSIYDIEGSLVVPDLATGKFNLFDSDGNRRQLYYRKPGAEGFDPDRHAVRALTYTKMEPNPLAGLWGPHANREEAYGVPADETAAYWIFQLMARNTSKTRELIANARFASDAQYARGTDTVKTRHLASMQTRPEENPARLALNIALKQLNKQNFFHLTPSDLSVVLQHYLVITGKNNLDDVDALAGLLQGENARLMKRLLAEPEFENYRQRVIDTAVDMRRDMRKAGRASVAPDNFMPGLRISPFASTAAETKDLLDPVNRTNVAVVFSGSPAAMQITVARLQQDADKAFEEGRIRRKINVLGVRADVLLASDKGKVNSVIYASDETDAVELNLEMPVHISWILPRNLSDNELFMHQQIAEYASEHAISISASLDSVRQSADKYLLYPAIENAKTFSESPADFFGMPVGVKNGIVNNPDVQTPAYKVLSVLNKINMNAVIADLIADILIRRDMDQATLPIYVQPEYGTEGIGVKVFMAHVKRDADGGIVVTDAEELSNAISAHIKKNITETEDLNKQGTAILREGRGNVFFAADESAEPVNITFRVNAGFDGEKAFAETGYAQVASSENPLITSVEQGGKVEDINIALHSLRYRDAQGGWQRFNPTVGEIKRIKKAAGDIARILDVKYGGVDFVLEVNQNGCLSAIVPLEMNARGVLSPSVKILETETLPVGYRTFRHRELAPVKFWQMVERDAQSVAAGAAVKAAARGEAALVIGPDDVNRMMVVNGLVSRFGRENIFEAADAAGATGIVEKIGDTHTITVVVNASGDPNVISQIANSIGGAKILTYDGTKPIDELLEGV